MSQWDWAGKRVLVTGGAGAIGSNLVCRLAGPLKCRVTVLDDLSQGRLSNIREAVEGSGARFVRGNINSERTLKSIFRDKFDVVYHLAASFANELSVERPFNDLDCNIRGTLSILLKSAKSKVKLFVYASSSSSYGPRQSIELKESFYPNPSTPYAVSKLTGEFYCGAMHHLYGLEYVALRFSNTYGPRDFPGRYRNVIPNFMKCAVLGQPLRITGTGNEQRDYTYIDDCVDGIVRASEDPRAHNNTFNLGTGKATKTIDLAKQILRVTGSDSKIVFAPPRYFDHIAKRWMNVSKARKTFGYDPKIKIDEGIERTWEWFQENKREILRVKL